MPQEAGEGPIKTWVWFPLPGDAIGRQRGAIRAYEHRRRTHDLLDIGLIHASDENTGVATVGDEIVAHSIQGVAATVTRHVTHATPSVLRLVRRDGDTDGVPRRDTTKIVQPLYIDVVPQARPHSSI